MIIEVWPGTKDAYNGVMHTHQAVAAYIITKVVAPPERKEHLMTELRKLKNDLQIGIVERDRAGFDEAAKRWEQFEMYRVFMNTLCRRFERIRLAKALPQ